MTPACRNPFCWQRSSRNCSSRTTRPEEISTGCAPRTCMKDCRPRLARMSSASMLTRAILPDGPPVESILMSRYIGGDRRRRAQGVAAGWWRREERVVGDNGKADAGGSARGGSADSFGAKGELRVGDTSYQIYRLDQVNGL